MRVELHENFLFGHQHQYTHTHDLRWAFVLPQPAHIDGSD